MGTFQVEGLIRLNLDLLKIFAEQMHLSLAPVPQLFSFPDPQNPSFSGCTYRWWAVLDLNQRPKDSGLRRFPCSLDYLITRARNKSEREGAGRSWDAYRIGSSHPSLCTFPPTDAAFKAAPAFGGLGSGLPCRFRRSGDGFPEFTRFFR